MPKKYSLISFICGLVAFLYFFIGPKNFDHDSVHWVLYGISWLFWAAALISVLFGVESLIKEGKSTLIWTIAGLILGGLSLLILLGWLSCAEVASCAPVAPPLP
jgi:hypothetical protein